jgi:hypothetical protein
MNNTLSVALAIIVLAFNAMLITYLVAKGDGNNSLHTSALAWAFFFSGGILVGFGLGSDRLLDIIASFTKR